MFLHFFRQHFSKILSKLHYFKKKFCGSIPRTRLAKFPKYFEPPSPPPWNKIVDMPLAPGDTGRQHILSLTLRAAMQVDVIIHIIVRLRRRNHMRYAWTKQAASYIVCTHVCLCVRPKLHCFNHSYAVTTHCSSVISASTLSALR